MLIPPTSPTILLVEDDPRTAGDIIFTVTHALADQRVQLIARPTVGLAWAWLAQHAPPALIIIDQYLGGEEGATLAARLQGDPRLAAVPRLAYSQVPIAAAACYTVCLRKAPGHAGLLAQIARLVGAQG